MAEVKGLLLICPKCGRELFRLSYTGILLAPKSLLLIICGTCGIGINVVDAFPNLFHVATQDELLPTTIPYKISTEGDKTG